MQIVKLPKKKKSENIKTLALPKQLAIGTKDVPIEKRGWPWFVYWE